MGSNASGRSLRVSVMIATLMALVVGAQGVAQAATPISVFGTIGKYRLIDTKSKPGGKCAYQGAAGSVQLWRARARRPKVWGTSDDIEFAKAVLILQRKVANGWKHVQRGKTRTEGVTRTDPATLPPPIIVVDPKRAPFTGKYRLVLKIVWLAGDGGVIGRVRLLIENVRRDINGSVQMRCPGQKVLV